MPHTDLLKARQFRAGKPSFAALAFACTTLLSACGGGSSAAPATVPTPGGSATIPGESTTTPGTSQGSSAVLFYNKFLPDAYAREPEKRWPLIISLHGAGGLIPDDDLIEVQARRAEGFGFIVV
jgi:hypothetical protein